MGIHKILASSKPFLKSSEVAKIFNVDHSTVFLWVKRKKLHPIRTPGGNFRFTRGEVDRLFRETRANEKERRRSPRFTVFFPVTVQIGKETNVCCLEGHIQDISDKGIGLVVHNNKLPMDDWTSGKINEVLIKNVDVGVFRDSVQCAVRHSYVVNDSDVAVGLLVS